MHITFFDGRIFSLQFSFRLHVVLYLVIIDIINQVFRCSCKCKLYTDGRHSMHVIIYFKIITTTNSLTVAHLLHNSFAERKLGKLDNRRTKITIFTQISVFDD